MRFAGWIPKATNTHSLHVILIALRRQVWLISSGWISLYTYIACLVFQTLDDGQSPKTCHRQNPMYQCSRLPGLYLRTKEQSKRKTSSLKMEAAECVEVSAVLFLSYVGPQIVAVTGKRLQLKWFVGSRVWCGRSGDWEVHWRTRRAEWRFTHVTVIDNIVVQHITYYAR